MRRALIVLFLTAGLIGPAETVVCTESDGRVGIEIGIGGRCADLVVTDRVRNDAPDLECPSCSDSLLPDASAAADRKGQYPEASAASPIAFWSPTLSPPTERQAPSLPNRHLPPRQHDQLASVVLLL